MSPKVPHTRASGVVLRGFGRQQRAPVDRIAAALETLPSFHLEGLREIEFDPERLGQKATGYFLPPRAYTSLPNFKCRAEYLEGEERIAVYAFASERELCELLHHEIGHHVCQRVIGGTLRKRWVTQIHPGAPAISAYAGRNAREDFAESYAAFALSPERLRSIPTKYAFMRDEVFASR